MQDPEGRSRAELVAELNDLLQLDHDAVQVYTQAIQSLKDEAYREALVEYRGDHQRHVEDLSRLIRGLGGEPVEIPHLPTGAVKWGMQAVAGVGGDREVLLAFKANEGQVRDKYRRHAERPHDPVVSEVLRRNALDEDRHYAWAVEVLRVLGVTEESTLGQAEQMLQQVQGRVADAIEGAERRIMEQVELVRRRGTGGASGDA